MEIIFRKGLLVTSRQQRCGWLVGKDSTGLLNKWKEKKISINK